MKKCIKLLAPVLAAAMVFTGCSSSVATESESTTDSSVEVNEEVTQETQSVYGESTSIALSDDGITVGGEEISTDSSAVVYAGAEIVYYEEGQDETYGEGSEEDEHSKEEADQNTVITITQPGTYEVSGTISYGQIAIDLGEDSQKDPEAVVNLILNNVEINCSVAPAIVIYNAYECGSDDEESATPQVDTTKAGFNLILEAGSENTVNGSYVAKVYKDGTTQEDVENGNAKKKYKFDAAIDSNISFNIESGENGKLTVNGENEGISSCLHMTINGGEITINAGDDAINTNEDNVSVLTINGGIITCDSGLGDEGDGIDSNGYIVINGGYIIACANAKSQDSGVDSDKGIYINGGTILASGNMYDEVSSDSSQSFAVFGFTDTVKENELIMITDENDQPVAAFSAVNDYSIVVYSSPLLVEGTYHLYKVSSVTGDLNGSIYTNITDYQDAVMLQYSSNSLMGGSGMDMGGERPEMPDGEEFQKPDGEMPEMPSGEMPQGFDDENFQRPDGERPETPDGEMAGGKGGKMSGMQGGNSIEPSTEFDLTATYLFGGIAEK